VGLLDVLILRSFKSLGVLLGNFFPLIPELVGIKRDSLEFASVRRLLDEPVGVVVG